MYGLAIKKLIHEEFGDGTMSATHLSMDIQRESDPKGDRCTERRSVHIEMSGRLLPYKTY